MNCKGKTLFDKYKFRLCSPYNSTKTHYLFCRNFVEGNFMCKENILTGVSLLGEKFLILLAAMVLTLPGIGQQGWALSRDKDGMKIYTRPSDDSPFDEFRATMQLDQSVHSLVAVLQDIENMPDWAYNVISGRILKEYGDTIQYYYTEVSIPFPFTNRDAVYRNTYEWKNDSSLLVVDIQMLPDYIEETENLVRIPYGKGSWRIKVLDNSRLDVTFQMVVDPGGSVPSWLANLFVNETPAYTFTKIREIIVKEKYQTQRFDFLE